MIKMMETKNEYKFTEIGKIPVEWDIARMESIGSTYGGLSGKAKDDFEEGNQNFVSYRQIFSNPLLKNQKFETVYVSEKEKQNEVEYGDVLFTTSSETPDEVAMSSVFLIEGPEKHFLNSFSFGYRFNNLQVIDPRYYGYYFRGEYFRKLTFKLAQGSTRYNISKNKLIEEVIHIPPIKEQQKIAEILSTVDEQLEQTNQLIEKTKELKKGLMQHLLTKGIGHTEFKQSELGEIPDEWEVISLKDITEKIGDGIHSTPKYNEEGTIPFINGNNIKDGVVYISEKTKMIDELEFSKYQMNLKNNSILLSINGTIGNVGIYSNERVLLGKSAAYLNPTNNINTKYLYYVLNSYYIKSYFTNELTGTTIRNLSLKSIKAALIMLPSLNEQKKIADILSSIDEEIDGYQKEKAKYEELKKGLMQQLLTGKKRVKV